MGTPLAELDLKALFLRHARQLQTYLLRRTRDPQLAADLAQESFLRLAEQGHREAPENVDAYLYRTARNLAIDHYRQELRRKTDALPNEQLSDIVADQPGPEESAVDANALDRLRRIVAELPPRTQEIFRLNRLEGLTHAEVAQCLAISESSVQKHLARALAHVMQALEETR
ncbi:MAG: putative RNA polymerase sigma factor FecI [Pseudomonas citronellolis]|nr:MAG: putative RNA polymerase sigma factor FecI [Pseudomonas citronellolis]